MPAKTKRPTRDRTKRAAKKGAVKKSNVKKGGVGAAKRPAKPAKKRKKARAAAQWHEKAMLHAFLAANDDGVFRALCASGDFEGERRGTEDEADADAAAHRKQKPSHVVKIIQEQIAK
jgi:hypothetical protein